MGTNIDDDFEIDMSMLDWEPPREPKLAKTRSSDVDAEADTVRRIPTYYAGEYLIVYEEDSPTTQALPLTGTFTVARKACLANKVSATLHDPGTGALVWSITSTGKVAYLAKGRKAS
jgi:hypothetical protein